MQDLFSLWSVFIVLSIAAARFLLLMPLNVSLFSFMIGFNSNWFISVGLNIRVSFGRHIRALNYT
jgi:hypothetical protein